MKRCSTGCPEDQAQPGSRPVAKLVQPDRMLGKGGPNLAGFHGEMPVFDPPLSTTVAKDRADRL